MTTQDSGGAGRGEASAAAPLIPFLLQGRIHGVALCLEVPTTVGEPRLHACTPSIEMGVMREDGGSEPGGSLGTGALQL